MTFFDQSTCRHPWHVDEPWSPVRQHHVVTQQHTRREGGDCGDGRNALALCQRCHERHHARQPGWVVELVTLRDENYAFAVELLGTGAAYEYLRRYYDGTDPRHEALLGDLGDRRSVADGDSW